MIDRQMLTKCVWTIIIVAVGFLAVFGYLAYSIWESGHKGSVAPQINLGGYAWVLVIVGFFIPSVIKGLKLRSELQLKSKEAARKLLDGFSPLNSLEVSIKKVLSGGWWTDDFFAMELSYSRVLVMGKLEADSKNFFLNAGANFENCAPFIVFTHRKRLKQVVCDDQFETMEMYGAELLEFMKKHKAAKGEKMGLVLYIGKQALIEEPEVNKLARKLQRVLNKVTLLRKEIDLSLRTTNRLILAHDGDFVMTTMSLPTGIKIRVGTPATTPVYLPDIAARLEKAWPEVKFAYLFLREFVTDRTFNYVVGLDLDAPEIFGRVIADLSQFVRQNPKPYEAYVDFHPMKPFDVDSEFCRLNIEPFYAKQT